MTAKEKYLIEKDELKTVRMNRILQSAFELFSEKGIDTIAMTDIAKQAEIGVASLYRYYETKEQIAIKTTIWAWEKQKDFVLPVLSSKEYEELNGLKKVENILNQFINLYENQKDFLRYIYFFDSFAVRTQIPSEKLTEYEKLIETVQKVVKDAIKCGLEDGSINKSYESEENILYFSIMHTFFSTVQKLCISGNMLSSDKKMAGKTQLETMAQIIIKGLSK